MPYKDIDKARECAKLSARKYRARKIAENPSFIRDSNLRAKYHLTLEEWNALIKKQNDLCALCSTKLGKRPCTDHKGNFVRGILCCACNSGLGKLQDSPELLRRAADYIEGRITQFIPIKRGH